MALALLSSPIAVLLTTIPTGNQSRWGAVQNSEPQEESPSSAEMWAQLGSPPVEVEQEQPTQTDTGNTSAHKSEPAIYSNFENTRQVDMVNNCTQSEVCSLTDRAGEL